ncbi:MAG: acetyl-CoA carboxylase carboxyltransferase subunit alpha [Lachnospiraceae bacterium]|nr:acetyl-CoA carboxylase carboxyltransferase subunit alpha [Lachnospiraceae bacterium]
MASFTKLWKKSPSTVSIRKEGDEGITREEMQHLWSRCGSCGETIYRENVRKNHYMCPRCGCYFRLSARQRLRTVIDKGSFEEWFGLRESVPVGGHSRKENPLLFPDYGEKLDTTREKTGLREAIVTGKARIEGCPAAVGVCDSRFLMGSMGTAGDAAVASRVERALAERLPGVLLCCSCRDQMQEGILSLMQMAKTAAALKRHSEAGLLSVTVLTDPTTGGVTASFAMLGDIILAEPGALIGFAGPRVIEQTIHQKLPEGFQRSEFLLEHGFIDRIVERQELRQTLAEILRFHAELTQEEEAGENARDFADGMASPVNVETQEDPEIPKQLAAETEESPQGQVQQVAESQNTSQLSAGEDSQFVDTAETPELSGKSSPDLQEIEAWEVVQRSRSADRLTSLDYISGIFEDFMEFHGDRYGGDDGAIVGGLARLNGRPVTVIGQQKGRSIQENKERNFGMPSPEGYRKAVRLMRQAEKFGRPIFCFVDTPGAFCGLEAEENGQGRAIADSLFVMSDLKVPVLSLVIGEGGSGGALAMAVGNEVWMMENAIYSVLSPEGFASILWKDSHRAQEAADIMGVVAADVKRLGIVERVIPEPEPACQDNAALLCEGLRRDFQDFLDRYEGLSGEELAGQRYRRFRRW